MPSNELEFAKVKGRKVAVDENGFVCLNDLHRASGFRENRKPAEWRRLEITSRLTIRLAERNMATAHNKKNVDIKSVIYAKRGQGGATFAHPVLAVAYAEYLSPDLAIEVKEVFLRYKAGDATLADDILQRAPAKDNEWAGVRALGRSTRHELTDTLQEHEVTKPVEFARVTNATYTALTGKNAKQLKAEKGVKPSGSLRDAMTVKELVFVMAAEQLAKERIEDEDSRGVKQCESAAGKSALAIRRAIDLDRADRTRKLV